MVGVRSRGVYAVRNPPRVFSKSSCDRELFQQLMNEPRAQASGAVICVHRCSSVANFLRRKICPNPKSCEILE
jgi:hypothetical protein